MAGRFIKLYDKILSWEWYSDINTTRLFIHLLLKANYKDQNFQGMVIHRGQVATSLSSLASQTCLSERQVRVSLDKLKMTGELSSLTCPRCRVITIIHYDDYQSDGRLNVSQMTSKMSPSRQAECHPDDKQTVSQNVTKYRTIDNTEQKEEIEKIEPLTRERTAQRFTPPTKEEIFDFCLEERLAIDVDRFFNYYTSNGWKVGKNPMKDWRATVRNWARKDAEEKPSGQVKKVVAQQYEQRDYGDEDKSAMMDMIRRMREAGYG